MDRAQIRLRPTCGRVSRSIGAGTGHSGPSWRTGRGSTGGDSGYPPEWEVVGEGASWPMRVLVAITLAVYASLVGNSEECSVKDPKTFSTQMQRDLDAIR